MMEADSLGGSSNRNSLRTSPTGSTGSNASGISAGDSTNHRVHIVRVVYQNVGSSHREHGPNSPNPDKNQRTVGKDSPCHWSQTDGGSTVTENGCNGCRLSTEIAGTDNWCCTTCTVTPCRCSVNGLAAASKCSSCDSFIEAEQQQQEPGPGPVQLEYSCRCHNKDVTVVKTVCAKCATKIHELLADILVCERRDHCVSRQFSVTTNSPDTCADLCSNCQVVGSRILNGNSSATGKSSARSNINTANSDVVTSPDIPPPLPKRKFITRGAVRTPPPPRKHLQHRAVPPNPPLDQPAAASDTKRRTPPPRRRIQRTRSADSLSDSDSSLSDSDYHTNLQYKPGVIPNEYIESDDFPTTANPVNVPLDLNRLSLTDPLKQYSQTDNRVTGNPHQDNGDSQTINRTGISSPINSSPTSSASVSPQSVNQTSSPETSSYDTENLKHRPGLSPMHDSSASPISLAEISSITNSSANSSNSSPLCLQLSSHSPKPAPAPDRGKPAYTVVEYIQSTQHTVSAPLCSPVTSDCDYTVNTVFNDYSVTPSDLIDLRSPVPDTVQAQKHYVHNNHRYSMSDDILRHFPIVLPEIETPQVGSFAEMECDDCLHTSCIDNEGACALGAEGGACTPGSLDIDFIVACDENGMPAVKNTVDLDMENWPSLVEFTSDYADPRRRHKFSDSFECSESMQDDVFEDAPQTGVYPPLDGYRDSVDGSGRRESSEIVNRDSLELYRRDSLDLSREREAIERYGPETGLRYDSVNDLEVARTNRLEEEGLYARSRHRRTGSAGGRVERNDESPPPKLPLKPSLSYNQQPPPIPRRDFKPQPRTTDRDRQIINRPHRISRPQTFEPAIQPRENPAPMQPTDNEQSRMPDIETNRTVTQLVFGSVSEPPAPEVKPPVEKPPDTFTLSTLPSVPAQQRTKKRPLSCLLKPKQTLNKIFHKKSSKSEKDKNPSQRQLPPIPVDNRDYSVTDPSGLVIDTMRAEMPHLSLLQPESPPGDVGDVPPPLLPRERVLPPDGVFPHHSMEQQAAAQHHNFIDSLIKLREVGWYWGPLSMDKAEAKLADKKDGSFLVRDSSHDSYILSLSFRSQNRTHHTRIEFFHGTFGFWSQPTSHGRMSIVEFIEKAMEHSRNGKFLYFLRPHSPGQAPSPVVLLYPISRYERIQSLQHACRFVILKYVRYDHIDELPLPTAIIKYLKDKHYFAENQGESEGD